MKINQKADLKDKSVSELTSSLADAEKALRQTHLSLSAGKEKNVRLMKMKKVEIAVIKTILHEKKLEEEND